MMRKILLTFPGMTSKKKIHEYLKLKMDLPEYYGNNLDALYDSLTDICEPTAVGIFLPVSDNDELDIELLLYLEKVKNVFLEAERDNSENLAVFTDDDIWDEDDLLEEEDSDEDPDEILSGFFEALDPENRKK